MAYITLLGQKSTHGAPVIASNQSTVTIKSITINVLGGQVNPHTIDLHPHEIALTNHMQSYVTINGSPIFLIGDSAACGSELCPDPQSKKPMQDFIQIS